MQARKSHSTLECSLIIGAPALLALAELFHPQPRDLLQVDLRMWLGVHYAQILLFPLSALATAALIRGQGGIAAAICRLALFLFAISWTAWDSVAGVATGIVAEAARGSATPEAWRAALDAIWTHPVMGGAPAPLFAVVGAVALSVGTLAAAAVLKRSGHSWGPVALLAVSSLGITIFKTHAWPGGPVTFGGMAVAGAWLVGERGRRKEPGSEPSHAVRTAAASD